MDVRPLKRVRRKLGLRELCHHEIGRHSVGAPVDDLGGELKTIQAQLGHRSVESTVKYVRRSGGA